MNVRLSKRAQRAIEKIDARWREAAEHPETFLRELLDAIDLLETANAPGTPCPTEKRPRLKRVLLEKSKCHVYFEINDRKQLIEVLTSGALAANVRPSYETCAAIGAHQRWDPHPGEARI